MPPKKKPDTAGYQKLKKDLADQIVAKGGISFGELTKDDILKMIEESRP